MNHLCSARPGRRPWMTLCGILAIFGAGYSSADAGFVIVPTYDASINSLSNATQVKGVINSAIQFYQSKLTDNITVNITFSNMNTGLGQSVKPVYTVSYANYLSALKRDATSASDATALANLPTQALNPVNQQSQMLVSQANLKALGFRVGSGSDGTVGLNTSSMFTSTIGVNSNKYDLYAVVAHEIDEVLGLGSGLGGTRILPQDLYRYNSTGQRSFTTSATAASYFSLDGVAKKARFNQSIAGDYGDWFSTGAHFPQVQDAFATPGIVYTRTMPNELLALDVIGYNIGASNLAAVSGLSGATYAGLRTSHNTPAIPEPSCLVLALLGGLGFGGYSLRNRLRPAVG